MNASPTDTYLRELDIALVGLPDATRKSILDDVRAHVADAAAEGRDLDAVLAALGGPEEVARDAREQLGVPAASATDAAVRAGRFLHWAALALSVLTAVFVTFLLPSYNAATTTIDPDTGIEETLYQQATLFEQLGIGIGLLPLLPAALILLPLLLPERARTVAGWIIAAAVTAAMIPAAETIGGFYIPVAMLLWGAMLVPLWIRRGRKAVSGRSWRIAGTLTMLLPAVAAFGGLVTGSLQDARAPFWVAAFIVFLLAILFALRVRYVDAIIAACGLGLMLLGVFDGGMLLLALWWAGGVWLTAGLCGVAARGGIR